MKRPLTPDAVHKLRERSRNIFGLLLILMTLSVFWQVCDFEFVDYDDTLYVTGNPHIRNGLTLGGMLWALRADLLEEAANADYWQPVTFLSRMMDVQIWGLSPRGHHLTNLLLHLANVFLVFLLWLRLTNSLWPSAWVAALFAFHPMQIDAVAWVTARKDTLSAFFALLACHTYIRAVRHPAPPRLFLSASFFALSLASKPAWVTLPLLLVLLDFWPLGRLSQAPAAAGARFKILAEKWPLFLVSLLFGILPFLGDSRAVSQAVDNWAPAEIPVAYVRYLWKVLAPVGIAVCYPPVDAAHPWQIAGALGLLAGLSLFTLSQSERHPYLVTGWFWFLIALAPAAGLRFENRFLYGPLLGPLAMAAWGAPAMLKRWRFPAIGLVAAAMGLVAACALSSSFQVGRWQTGFTLFQHALRVTRANPVAHAGLAAAHLEAGQMKEAIYHFASAIRYKPDFAYAHNQLATAFAARGKHAVAMRHYRMAVRLDPSYVEAHRNLGLLLARQGNYPEAIQEFEDALRIRPSSFDIHALWANVLFGQGRWREAARHYREVLRHNVLDAEVQHNLAVTLVHLGQLPEAVTRYEQALRLRPDFREAHKNLGDLALRLGKFEDARAHLAAALELDGRDAETYNDLGLLAYRQRQFEEAVRHFEAALAINPRFATAANNLAQAKAENSKSSSATQDAA